MKVLKPALIAGVLLLLAGAVSGQTTIFTASLTGAQEVPPTGSSGTGSATLTLNNSSLAWTLTGTFSGLTGTATDAHIHGPALPGAVAAPVTGISFTSGATSGTISGSGTFSSSQASDLLAGLYYINIHSTAVGSGEIRGQLTAVPEPATYALAAGAVALLATMMARRGRKRSPMAVG